ncbi:hypothetical protein HAX54_005313 [Datura stramonium]|uniref:Uncharacterized protein n=1 Tax=Datura stramonium TaxID=4076 RepID=A0ABS8T991_DATST|nr:hypothetical protein [Datura stramonium]
MEEHRLNWFNVQKEVKYALKNWIDEGCLALEFPTIRDSILELGLGYVFAEPEECNLITFVRKFYANWNTSCGGSTKIKVGGQVAWFTIRSFNPFLGTSVVDIEMYFMILEKPPYRDIRHTLHGEHSDARWARVKIASLDTPISLLD